ncbi:hypothetical protein GX48_00955 [Paracoccidioides brasiliensis]|nr:hypothetical protein GX48_00955 [Paracoccidioides brasiliensis]
MGLVPAPNPAYFPIRPGTVLEHPFSTCNSSVPRDKLTLTSPSQKIQSNQLGLDWRGLIGGASSNSPSPPNHCRRHFPELNSSIVQTCIPFAFHCFRAEQRELRSNTTTTMRMSLSGICQTILETDDGWPHSTHGPLCDWSDCGQTRRTNSIGFNLSMLASIGPGADFSPVFG